jgi:hypothetical protein
MFTPPHRNRSAGVEVSKPALIKYYSHERDALDSVRSTTAILSH